MRPWPRELHAKLLRRLTAAGAKAVVFDIVFSRAGPDPDSDDALAEAIRTNGRVILAAEYNNNSSTATDDTREWTRLGSVEMPYAAFTNVAAGWGIATLGIDDDKVARRYVAGFADEALPTLSWATAAWLGSRRNDGEAMQAANRRWIRYYGPPLAIPHIRYSQALDPAGVRDDFFRDKIVFVGARPQVELFNAPEDQFRSPATPSASHERAALRVARATV